MRVLAPVLGVLLFLGCGSLQSVPTDVVGCRATVTPGGERAEQTAFWVHLDDQEDRTFQNAWCAAVGPAVMYTPEPEGGRPEWPQLDSLLVVSFNAHIGEANLDGLVSAIRSGELTGAPVEHFVVLLQEVHRSGEVVPAAQDVPTGAQTASAVSSDPDRPDIVEDARRLGLHLFYVPSMRSGVDARYREDRGNAILSTMPLTAPRALELPQGLQRRVTAVAWVDAKDRRGTPWQLGVASTHLDNAEVTSPFASFGSIRGRQAEGLVRMLPQEGALAVGGDFNTWFAESVEYAYRRMRHHFPYPLDSQDQPTAVRLGEGRVLDYVFFRGPEGWTFDDARAPSMYGSDHYPVYGWVHVGTGRTDREDGGDPAEAG